MTSTTQTSDADRPVAPQPVPAKPPRQRGRFLRRAIALVVVIAVSTSVVLLYRPQPLPVDVARAERGDIEVVVEEDGVTRVKDRYQVSAPLLARLSRIELSVGDDVEPGTVLARLSPSEPPLLDARSQAEARARVASAQAALRQAEAAVRRLETSVLFAEKEESRQARLVKAGSASPTLLERASLSLETQRDELASARFGARVAAHQLQLAKVAERGYAGAGGKQAGAQADEVLEVKSPISGRVLRVLQRSEGIVQPATPLLELGDCSALELVVDVLTSDAVAIDKGALVRIQRWGGAKPLVGHVRMVEPSAFTEVSALGVEEQRANVIVDLDSPREVWRALGDGYRVEAQIVVERRSDVLRIPLGAVFRVDGQWSTFVVEGEHVRRVQLEIGHRNAQWVEIQAGVSEGDEVVLFPSDQIVDDVLVKRR